jgi:hypothetical protein
VSSSSVKFLLPQVGYDFQYFHCDSNKLREVEVALTNNVRIITVIKWRESSEV